MLKALVVGFVLGILAVVAGVYFYFSTGRAPVAANGPEMPFEHRMAHMALDAYLAKQPHPEPQVPADEKNLLAGAEVYKQNCAVCHGVPGSESTSIAAGMSPKPPQLFHGVGVTDDEPWESYWIVENGVHMTGMPSFHGTLNETQIWQVVMLVKNADKVPATVRGVLTGITATPTPSGPAAGTPASK